MPRVTQLIWGLGQSSLLTPSLGLVPLQTSSPPPSSSAAAEEEEKRKAV